MSLNDWANIAIIVQGIFVIVSIGFVLYQLREGTRLIRAANTQKFVELTSPFHVQFIQDRRIAELSIRGETEWDTLDMIDRRRYYTYLLWRLILHENIYHQKRKKLIDEDTYVGWVHDLKYFMSQQNFKLFWSELKHYFEPSFVTYVDQLLEGENSPGRNR